jgi:hypothetical protein
MRYLFWMGRMAQDFSRLGAELAAGALKNSTANVIFDDSTHPAVPQAQAGKVGLVGLLGSESKVLRADFFCLLLSMHGVDAEVRGLLRRPAFPGNDALIANLPDHREL